jgi:hypothetical protein
VKPAVFAAGSRISTSDIAVMSGYADILLTPTG